MDRLRVGVMHLHEMLTYVFPHRFSLVSGAFQVVMLFSHYPLISFQYQLNPLLSFHYWFYHSISLPGRAHIAAIIESPHLMN